MGKAEQARPASHRTEYHDPTPQFRVQFARKFGERRHKLSLRLAGPGRAQTLKKQAIARGVLAETAVVTSNMG